VLEHDRSAVLAFTRTATVDEHDRVIKVWEPRPELGAETPHRRFRESLRPLETHPIWGLTRVEVLRRTPLFGSYPAHDLPLLAELALCGRLREVPEVLFLQREHGGRSVRTYDFRAPHQAVGWYDTRQSGRLIFPRWRLLSEYLAALSRAPLSARERVRCARELLPWLRRSAGTLLSDLAWAFGRLPTLGPPVRDGYYRLVHGFEQARLRRVAHRVQRITDDRDVVLLVGESWLVRGEFEGRRTLPFLEHAGEYVGSPADDDTAIRELERMRSAGATLLVFAWPDLWWLEHYARLREHLLSRYRTVLEDTRVVAFALEPRR